MIKYGINHDYLKEDEVTRYDYCLVIKGPGLEYEIPVIKELINRKVEIITDIEYARQRRK